MSDTTDSFALVQQVQGMVEGYVRLRSEKAQLEEKIFQLNQDNARIQKAMKALVAENEALKPKSVKVEA